MKIILANENISIKRSVDQGNDEQINIVKQVIEDVKNRGDEAVKYYTQKFDRTSMESMLVQQEEFDEAYAELDNELVEIIKEAAQNIQVFHEKQKRESWKFTNEEGTTLGQKITPIDAVGVYVPGGTAAYPSSVLMNVMPAKVAGVKRIVMVTPPSENGRLSAGVLGRCKRSRCRRNL